MKYQKQHLWITLLVLFLFIFAKTASAERIFFAGYNGGFYIKSEEEGGMELRLGGAFQADYRYYNENQRTDNRFDLRRARLLFRGKLTRWVRFGMQFEFQGNETSNIVDAYGEAVNRQHFIRFGQFKEPFSLEWQTKDKGLFFAERSMGYSLSPKRDVGIMYHGVIGSDTFNIDIGLFNGDGPDGSTGGSEEDAPEVAGRVVIAPFKTSRCEWLKNFQVGSSATYAKIDTVNIDLKVKSTGMSGSTRNIYTLTHNTKFGVVQSVDERLRGAAEFAWSNGPVGITAEYINFKYTNLEAAGETPKDAGMKSWYTSFFWNITGENVVISKGVVKPVYPDTFFNPDNNTWGALCLAFRIENFEGDELWINPASKVSVRNAKGYSLALNWIPFPMCRMVFDLTHTKLSDNILVNVLPDGRSEYIDKETVFTTRFSIDF
jgi:phosphate-selective porin OprO/OprP